MADIQKRKEEHLRLAMTEDSQGKEEMFSHFTLPYRALPEINYTEVDTSFVLLKKQLRQPLIIASMTGGVKSAEVINTNLAKTAEKMKVALGVGSQRAALEKPEVRKSFEVIRKYAPNTVIFANMGAVQLNYSRGIKDYEETVKMVGADALYLHVNPIQEALQPEGDTNFKFLISKIQNLINKIKVPVFIKEVGCGLDPVTAKKLVEIGVAGIDIAGVGGTSWAWIEGRRLGNNNLTNWFADFGLRTDAVIEELAGVKDQVLLVASGGIRNPIQGLKSHLLGADLYSAAKPFLEPAIESAENVEKTVADWEKGLRIAMFGIGAETWKEAGKKKIICRTKV
jgi:isopentenyl-diphosphate delta-isomerase